MPADNRPALVAATRRRADQTRARRPRSDPSPRPGRRRSHIHGGVAAAAKTSRSLLYRDADIRAEIQRLRAREPGISRLPAAQRTSDISLQQRLTTLLDDNRALRDENRKLRDQIAALLGEQRATSTPSSRRWTPTIGPCS